jgi:arsenite/tail-anchored protein-transporting ATPase
VPLSDLAGRRPWTFVGGKGGVGKTTAACALALELADAGRPTLLVSTDSAHSTGDALGQRLSPEPTPVQGAPGLRALEVDAEAERARFLSAHRASLARLLDEGTYLDAEDIDHILGLAFPGIDEVAALLRLTELPVAPGDAVVVDTAPTGHALRLLDLPAMAAEWLRPLRAMDRKRAAVAGALARRAVEEDSLLGEIEARRQALARLLTDAERAAFLLVTNPEPVVQAETLRYLDALSGRGITVGGVLVNRAHPGTGWQGTAGPPVRFAPRLPHDPVGVESLRAFGRAVAADPAQLPENGPRTDPGGEPAAGFTPSTAATVHLVAGKGGVGKSTVAAALAVWLATRGEREVLLLGIDPAGSLHDVLELNGDEGEGVVPGIPRLAVRQLDAEEAWDAFRARLSAELEEVLEGMSRGGLGADADRRVLEELIELAPPGIDEVAALLEVLDAVEREGRVLVLDTPPTGHLLRFLEMPEVARAWVRVLLRLLLKYRSVVRLGSLAEELLNISGRLGDLGAVLRDRDRTAIYLVALPEALSAPETGRLRARLGELGYGAAALVVNRAGRDAGDAEVIGSLVAAAGEERVVLAPDLEPGPRGADGLARFLAGWRCA